MSQNHTFRAQTGWNPNPASGVFDYYTNLSGILHFITSGGSVYPVGTYLPSTGLKSTGALSNVVTGNAVFAGINSVVYGASGNSFNSAPTVLGEPSFWLPFTGPNGQLLAVPAYTRTN